MKFIYKFNNKFSSYWMTKTKSKAIKRKLLLISDIFK